jgi:hypothetical protein
MSYQGYMLSNSQIIRKNVTQLSFQGRLSDGRRFHWTVTCPGLVFFIDLDKTWTPPGAFRKFTVFWEHQVAGFMTRVLRFFDLDYRSLTKGGRQLSLFQ